MREYLFRGKSKTTQEWCYGYYVCDKFIDLHLIYPGVIAISVISDTISEYSGVTDKNETKVFENDKVIVHENVCGEIKDWTAKVAFKGGSFCLVNEDDYPICSLFEVCGTFEVIPE